MLFEYNDGRVFVETIKIPVGKLVLGGKESKREGQREIRGKEEKFIQCRG